MRLALGALIVGLSVSAAAAAPDAPSAPQASPSKTVAPVTVVGRSDPPKIVSSFPAAGAVVAPGVLVLKISFDEKMLADDFAVAAAPGAQMPSCLKTPRLLNDQKTFVLLCTTAPKSAYSLAFNAAPEGGFANIGGQRAAPVTLSFSTNDEDGPRDLAEAMKVAKLTDADAPIPRQPTLAAAAGP